MRKVIVVSACVAVVLALALPSLALAGGKKAGCTRIQDGVLVYEDQNPGHYLGDEPLVMGYDIYGYNYNAHMFNGLYCNAYLGRYGHPAYEGDAEDYLEANPDAEDVWCWPCRDVRLMMKWSDIWLSNMDCNLDEKLDRGYLCDSENADSSACEGAWLTNHMAGECEAEGLDGSLFVKIVALPEGAYCEEFEDCDPELTDGYMCYTAAEEELGCRIWGAFAIIQEVESGEGATYVSPVGPGLGKW